MANIDKDAVLAELRNSIQNPRAGEVLIQRIENGDFDAAAVDKPAEKPRKGAKQQPDPETASAPQDDAEKR